MEGHDWWDNWDYSDISIIFLLVMEFEFHGRFLGMVLFMFYHYQGNIIRIVLAR